MNNKYLLTSRFNNETNEENKKYIKKNEKLGCVYCSPEKISKKINDNAILFILEMNNDTNKIIGIGMVKNSPICGRYSVYKNGNYNRFVFTGKYRIDRNEMNELEENVMKAFDILCFTGNRHMKRGQGLKSFPTEMLNSIKKVIDLIEFITEMFKKRFIEKTK
jgi:hypothetical protein